MRRMVLVLARVDLIAQVVYQARFLDQEVD
jgi:hypothetical protein